jgi:hypothetical protein
MRWGEVRMKDVSYKIREHILQLLDLTLEVKVSVQMPKKDGLK